MKSELDHIYNQQIGSVLREGMKKKNLSLEELSQQVGGSIPKPTLARYVRGENAVPDSRLQIICQALGIDYLELKQWALSAAASELDTHKYDVFTDPSWRQEVKTLDGHEIDPCTLTVDEALLIGYYRDADQSRQRAVRVILGMEK